MNIYLIQTVQSFRNDYAIKAKSEEDAIAEFNRLSGEIYDFSQKELGEVISYAKEIDEHEFLKYVEKETNMPEGFYETKLNFIHECKYDDWEFS